MPDCSTTQKRSSLKKRSEDRKRKATIASFQQQKKQKMAELKYDILHVVFSIL